MRQKEVTPYDIVVSLIALLDAEELYQLRNHLNQKLNEVKNPNAS